MAHDMFTCHDVVSKELLAPAISCWTCIQTIYSLYLAPKKELPAPAKERGRGRQKKRKAVLPTRHGLIH